MKMEDAMENPRPTYGWGIADRDGDLWFHLFPTRKDAIEYVEIFFAKEWRTIKHRHGLSIVKVELIKSDWSW